MEFLKKFAAVIKRKLMFLFFELFCSKSLNEKLILFAYNENYSEMPDNMVGIYNFLKEKGYDCRKMHSPSEGFRRLLFNFTFQKYYATCKCVFLTDNFAPVYAHKPRKGTKVIQLWHACGAFKKWGYSTIDLAWGGDRKNVLRFPMHNTYTDAFVSSKDVIPCYKEAFRCPDGVLKAFGTPRTDVYFDESFVSSQREEVLKVFPEIGDRKIILYAPTFRGNSPDLAHNENKLDYSRLKSLFGKDYVLLLKLHPFTAKKFALSKEEERDFGDFVFNGSQSLKIETALCAADILIADYSSLIFEYSLLNRPMLFFAYDLEEYDRDRSFYYDYESFVPGKIVRTNEELEKAILDGDFESEKIPAFREKFMSACDGHCVERISEYSVS